MSYDLKELAEIQRKQLAIAEKILVALGGKVEVETVREMTPEQAEESERFFKEQDEKATA